MNKIINKVSLLSLASISLFSFASCGKKTYYHDITKLVPYMHMISYDDYAVDTELESVEKSSLASPGCSVIKNGNFLGRNFDFYYSYTPYFLIKVKGNANRYASIGIAYNSNLEEDDIIATEKNKDIHNHQVEIVPNHTVDGINENGVTCSINVADLKDLPGKDKTITGTNPGKPNLYAYFVCRYVLDRAKSAKHAIELLEETNIYLEGHEVSNLHYIIADKDETYAVELYDNKLVSKKKEGDEQIMTNFYLNLTNEQIKATYEDGYTGDMTLPNNAHGVERYVHLKKKYNVSDSVASIRNTLKEIRFSTIYPDCGGEIPAEPINPTEDYSQTQIHDKKFEGWEELYQGTRMVLDNHRRDIAKEYDVWITTHSSIYDIDNKKLSLIVQEDYSRSFEVSLDDFIINQVSLF